MRGCLFQEAFTQDDVTINLTVNGIETRREKKEKRPFAYKSLVRAQEE